jgi:alkylation response protein AidB-like acyl-CoA dehydrogenase
MAERYGRGVRSLLVDRAHEIADTVLFPVAVEVDATSQIPDTHWQSLADAGLYGIAVPGTLGGPGLDLADVTKILEVVASGCLATAFTWMQHHGVMTALSASTNTPLRESILPGAAAGIIRCGVAFAGAVPVPPRMRANRVDGGWRLSGHAPFVSGWGIIELIQISAGDTDSGDIIAAIVPAELQPGITTVTPQPLFVADATRTVSLDLDGLVITDDRIVNQVSRADFMANQNFASRFNGTLPLGVVRRCVELLDEAGETDAAEALRWHADGIRKRLDEGLADSELLLAARAEGAELAVRASAVLIASAGGMGILRSSVAQLLAREAMFTLVAASRPELKRNLVKRFSQGAG